MDPDRGTPALSTPFRTEVLVETAESHILAAKRKAVQILPELFISGIERAIELTRTSLTGVSWLLPASRGYSVLFLNSNRRERN